MNSMPSNTAVIPPDSLNPFLNGLFRVPLHDYVDLCKKQSSADSASMKDYVESRAQKLAYEMGTFDSVAYWTGRTVSFVANIALASADVILQIAQLFAIFVDLVFVYASKVLGDDMWGMFITRSVLYVRTPIMESLDQLVQDLYQMCGSPSVEVIESNNNNNENL